MHFSSDLLNEAAMAACWTLVHSLWQGLLLTVLTGLVVMSTRTSRPVVRYRLLSALMVLFVTGAAVTFAREWSAQVGQRVAADGGQGFTPVAGAVGNVVPGAGGSGTVVVGAGVAPMAITASAVGLLERVSVFLSEHAGLIVLVWLLIIGVRLGRMCWALAYTRRIRLHESQPLPEYWTDRLKEMSGRLKLSRPVLLLESAVMKVPVAFGHLKPVIFIPIGLFSQLPAEQAEAILLHELAHIKRDDYLMNLLQSMTEHLFFFNPAVLWLSALLREERENCCDDMTIAETRDKKPLVRALIGFRELSACASPVYEMGFAGRRNVFVNRIARIVQNKSKGLTVGEGVFFGFSILLIGFLAMAFKQGAGQTTGGVRIVVVDTLPHARSDTSRHDDESGPDRMVSLDVDLPHGKQVLVALHKDQLYYITQVNGVVTELMIGDKRVPAGKIAGYGPTIRQIYTNLDRVRIDKMVSGESEDSLGIPQDLRRQREVMDNAKRELLKRLKDLQAAQVDIERQNIDRQAIQNELKDREVDLEKERKELIDRELDLERAQKAQLQESGIISVMKEAVRQGIVSDVAEIRSLLLTKETLVINGKKQSAAIQAEFRKKFVLTPDMEFHFDSSDK